MSYREDWRGYWWERSSDVYDCFILVAHRKKWYLPFSTTALHFLNWNGYYVFDEIKWSKYKIAIICKFGLSFSVRPSGGSGRRSLRSVQEGAPGSVRSPLCSFTLYSPQRLHVQLRRVVNVNNDEFSSDAYLSLMICMVWEWRMTSVRVSIAYE